MKAALLAGVVACSAPAAPVVSNAHAEQTVPVARIVTCGSLEQVVRCFATHAGELICHPTREICEQEVKTSLGFGGEPSTCVRY